MFDDFNWSINDFIVSVGELVALVSLSLLFCHDCDDCDDRRDDGDEGTGVNEKS